MKFRDDLIEIGARALCKAHNNDPDFVPTTNDKTVQQILYIGGVPVPNWKHHVKNAATVIDAIFDHQKPKAAA